MYTIYNTYTRQPDSNKFLSRNNANDRAQWLSEKEYGNLCVIDEETGMISDIWTDGENTYSAS